MNNLAKPLATPFMSTWLMDDPFHIDASVFFASDHRNKASRGFKRLLYSKLESFLKFETVLKCILTILIEIAKRTAQQD